MKNFMCMALLSCALWTSFMSPHTLYAQQCQDEEGIAKDYLKDLNDMVETSRKENLDEFEKSFHQKSTLSKLGITLGMVKELGECLQKAVDDPATPKDQVDALKTMKETYSKLADKLTADHKALKAADDPKAAKAIIEKFDYSK